MTILSEEAVQLVQLGERQLVKTATVSLLTAVAQSVSRWTASVSRAYEAQRRQFEAVHREPVPAYPTDRRKYPPTKMQACHHAATTKSKGPRRAASRPARTSAWMQRSGAWRGD